MNEEQDESDSSSDDDNNNGHMQSLAESTAEIDVAQELQERQNMKQFFKESTVYKNFKEDENKELVKRQECIETDDEIQNYQEKLTGLQQKYNSLQGIMFP
jgi:hypothetical protein